MWVCLCRGVTDSQINDAIEAGARTPGQIGRRCGAGTGCGGCLPELRRLLRERLNRTTCFDGRSCLEAADDVYAPHLEVSISIPA